MNEREGFVQLDADAARKRCALALHAVPAHDRDWVLAQLPAMQRTELEQLVRELRELGIPADSRMAQDALRRRPASKAEPACADASDMADLLEQEPPFLIAQALMLHSTSREAVLALLSANKRRQVQQLLGSFGSATRVAPLPPALSRSLSDELAIRLRQRPQKHPRPKERARGESLVGLDRACEDHAMKARHKAGIAPPAAVLRGIAMNAQPHALARPPRPSIPSPVKVHALSASMRTDATLGSAAQTDHKALQEQAFSDGYKEGYAAGRSDALVETLANSRLAIDAALEGAVDDGRALGLKEGRETASAELEQARTTLFEEAAAETKCRAEQLERLLSSIESQAASALWDAEDDLVALAHEVICKVLGSEALAAETIRAEVKSLLAQHGQRTRLAVHVHPDDIVALQGKDGDPWRWVADQGVQLGGVILRSPDGSLDARLETQLAALNDALLAARAERRAQYIATASLSGDPS